ncbi:hypothetical protein J7F03_28425 [Streptomyces sp. ISL-43]|uniref:hypothetical protein n=1 Tax=Streptomyces sp. ISL-43 TaxID=2819183 RepID=UPI001BEC0E70|nr:hypothetical protein [Streptomyces sp. ISL-43]MBT2450931.1 hypothetical protein [Streptomyces sp. ISL-43]
MKKVTAPAGAVVHGPHAITSPAPVWFIRGEAYVADNDRHLPYFTSAGYTIEAAPDGAPGAYTTAVARMQDMETRTYPRSQSVTLQDAAQPGEPLRNYWP